MKIKKKESVWYFEGHPVSPVEFFLSEESVTVYQALAFSLSAKWMDFVSNTVDRKKSNILICILYLNFIYHIARSLTRRIP